MKRSLNFVIENGLLRAFAFLAFLLTVVAGSTYAQVGVGTTDPDPSAQLDVYSTNKGFLTPRLTQAQRLGITSPGPATGLLVYQTDGVQGFYYYTGSGWVRLSTNADPGVGFTARKSTLTVNGTTTLNNFSEVYDEGNSFNPATGTYVVPETGVYRVSAVVNYATTAALTLSLGSGVNPKIALSANGTEKLIGLFPILNVNIALLLSLRAILGSGAVIVTGDVPLTAGDVVNLQYVASGLTINVNLGSGDDNGIVWSMRKL